MESCDNAMRVMEMQSNLRLHEKFQEGGIKVAEKQAEASISASREINVHIEKIFISERCKEIKRRAYEEIARDKEGKLIVIKKNPLVDLGPNDVSNMANPRLWIVRRCGNPDDYLYELRCDVCGVQRIIFLNPSRITERDYVLRKFSSQGVLIYGKAKALIPEIFAYLIINRSETDEYEVPDCHGWFMTLKRKIGFANKEDLTWKKLIGSTR